MRELHSERSVTAKAVETRARILDAALRLFAARGFESTTMRDIAAEAGLATGATYYYFRSKEDLVMAFYVRTNEEARALHEEAIAGSKDVRRRLRSVIQLKLSQFSQHRDLLGALLRVGVDPRHRLSPFGEETREIREENIALFERAVEGSALRVPNDLAAHLPRLLWMFEMAIIYYWIIDRSPGQVRTARVLDVSLNLIVQLVRAASLPLMRPVRKRVIELVLAAAPAE